MLKALYSRINAIDLKRPYVWKLKISQVEFAALENAVKNGETTALQNVVYLAEWYRRSYDGGASKPVREFDCKTLFQESGIEESGNLFQTESGKKTWQYSIYILGGFSIPFELGKNDTKFLKSLCRLYYGEDVDIDNIGGAERAVAFRESVRSFGCLYEYIKEIVSDKAPFAIEDVANKESVVNAFISRIKSANDSVLKSKFDLEWIFAFERDYEYMTRKVRLLLKPESLGGVNNQYLRYTRVLLWGIKNPDKCNKISIGLRFLQDGNVVCDADFINPIIVYSNTGNQAAGFVAWGTESKSKKIVAPPGKFNFVEIVAQDDSGKEYIVEKFDIPEWMQVFRIPDSYCEWTSRHYAQRESAVICPCDFKMLDIGATETIYKKRFWVNNKGVSEFYQWRSVYDKVRFETSDGEEIVLFNRQGYDQIIVRLHNDILRYHDGCVEYCSENDGEYEEELLPIVFSKEDLIVRHFETLHDMRENAGEGYQCEKIEFLDKGKFVEWNDEKSPSQGKVRLRLTVRGVFRPFVAYVLPIKITRDCENGVIRIGEEEIKDEISMDYTPLNPVVYKNIGSDDEFVSLEIWRATKHKEFIRNGKVVEYVEDGEEVEISYILKDGLSIHDFSNDGYREYECEEMGNIYKLECFSPDADHNLNALLCEKRCNISESLDLRAPSWLWVNLAKTTEKTQLQKFVYWNYSSDCTPQIVDDGFQCQGNDIKFADLQDIGEALCARRPEIGEPDPFAAFDDGLVMDIVDAFEVATSYSAYYFMMEPFRQCNLNIPKELCEQLIKRRNGQLTEKDKKGLKRFSEEFGCDLSEFLGVYF